MVLAIDPSLTETGYAVLDGDKVVLYGTIKPKKSLENGAKLLYLENSLMELIGKNQIAEICYEIPFVGQNPNVAIKLGMARGIIERLGAELGLPIYPYVTTTIKSAMGYGRADKNQVRQAVRMLTRVDTTNDNISDAIAVGLCHQAKQAMQERITKSIYPALPPA